MSGKNFIPFGKPNYSDEEIKAVSRVMQSGWVGMGPETIAFEEELAAALDAPQVILVNSCTSALFLALLTHGVKAGDEVICPSLTWCSTANVALYLGAKAVFCDVDPDTMCLTPETVRAALTPRTKAVMLVHYGGLAVDPEPIRAVLPPEVAIIEDAAHALGSLYPDGRRVGASGNIACFSFYANKNLATGEGGALAVADPRLAERFRALRLHGLPTDAWKRYSQPKHVFDYQISELGYKMNYTDLQACIGRIQLRRQTEFHATRLKIAAYYHDRLSGLQPAIRFQSEVLSPGHSRHLFVIRLPIQELSLTRNELLMELRKRQIGASIHYSPLHFMPFYYQAGEEPPKLPHTEQLYEEILTLPISASLEFQEAEYIMDQMIDQFETAKMSTGPKRSIK